MELTIEKGKHYDKKLFSTWPFFGKKEFKKIVRFDKTCEYDLPDYHQSNVNKLFGASFGFFAGHVNSIRFGWFWNETDKMIDLVAYSYDNKTRNWDAQMTFPLVAQVALGQTVVCSINLTPTHYNLLVESDGVQIGHTVAVPHGDISSWGMTMSLYFGGEMPAPHEMHITME